MKITIITPTYNSEKTIRDTIISIQQQTYTNIEHIIIDGGSKDNTLQIIKSMGHTGPVISERDNGIYDAMNKGIKIATGDIVGILNSDDFYAHNNVIKNVVKGFTTHDCDAVYGDLVYVSAEDEKKVLRKWMAGSFTNKMFYRGWMPPHPTFFVKRELYEKYGSFNTTLKSAADYELLLRFMHVHKITPYYLNDVLVKMRAGGKSNSSLSNRIAAHKEDHLAWKLNNVLPKWYTLAMKPARKIPQFIM
jgi:glycosyltransferase